jgi:hypothetical protein
MWHEARLAGDFLDEIEEQSSNPEVSYEGRSAAEWMTWARERRDAFDPSRWNIGDLWTDLASVAAWEYRDRHHCKELKTAVFAGKSLGVTSRVTSNQEFGPRRRTQ